MITPSFSPTATERVLPRLALDFTTAVLDPRVTVTRALNTATVVNADGTMSIVNADLPRFDYENGVCKGLLIEESRSNAFEYSQEFNLWGLVAASVSANVIDSPYKTATADKLIATAVSGYHGVRQSKAFSSGSNAISVWAKAAEYSFLRIFDFSAGGFAASFNLNDGTVSNTTGANFSSAYAISVGNGWYRCVLITNNVNATRSASFIGYPAGATLDGYGASYTGDGTSGIYLWGAQLEAGAFATSYIPTTTTILTRNADVVSMTGTNFSDWFNASEGSLMLQGDTLTVANPNSTTLANLYLNSSNNIRFWVWSGQPTNLRWSVTASGASSADIPNAITANTSFKAVGSYKLNKFAYALNGAATTEDLSGNVPSGLDQFFIGSIGGVNEVFSGHIAKINFYPQSLTNSEIQAFSK